MNNKPLEIVTIFLDFANLAILIFSTTFKFNGVVAGLSILAILTFSSIWFIEHVRNGEVANIKVETPQLSHTEVMMRDSGRRALMSTVDARIEDWKKEQEQRIQEMNAKYLGQEKLVFGIGVLITIVIAYFFVFPASL